MKLAISRKREFMADATAVEFTRNPDALISALEKLDSDTSKLKQAIILPKICILLLLLKVNKKS